MTLSILVPAAFPALALAHFVALLSPGQDFFLILGHSVRHSLRGSKFICLGIATGNGVYILIAILGWTGIRDHPVLFSLVEWCGAFYLIWLGYQLAKSRSNPELTVTGQEQINPAGKQFVQGLSSALLNPKNALFYMSLMAVILGNQTTLLQQVFCGVWMVTAVLFWDLSVAAMAGHRRVQANLKRYLPLIEKGAGFILIFMGIGLFL